MNFFDNCKQCSIMVGNGSGVLFQPKDANYSYVLTAKHNLKNKKNIQFKFKKIYKHKSLDIAIIKIKKREFISPKIQIIEPKDKEVYKLYGYPLNRREEKIKILAFDLKIRDIHNKSEIIVFNEDYDAEQKDIDGCSGGGVFKEAKQGFLLSGIECRMDKESKKEENNTRLRFISIKSFDEIVEMHSNELVYLDDSKNITQSQSHIIYKDGYIEPRTVYIEELKIHVAVCPVTFEEYDLFCEDTNRDYPNDRGWGRGKKPVINVSLEDANQYCEWLSRKSGKKYQLPSSQNWLDIATNNKQQDLNFKKCAWYGGKDMTIEVNNTTISEDSLGIRHIYGNVSEWCEDKIVMGGSFESSCIDFLLEKEDYVQNHTYQTIGFRIIN